MTRVHNLLIHGPGLCSLFHKQEFWMRRAGHRDFFQPSAPAKAVIIAPAETKSSIL